MEEQLQNVQNMSQQVSESRSKFSLIGTDLIRIGIASVFIWFGVSGILNPDMFTSLVPAFALTIAGAKTLVIIHGIVELVFGTLLVLNIGRRISAIILFLSIAQTLTIVSGPTLARDIALAVVMLGVAIE